MHPVRPSSLLLLYATQSASLVLSNIPRSNPLNQATRQILQPANLLIQPQNQTGQLTTGTEHDIGSNLIVYITLGGSVPAEPLYKLLVLAKEQVHDRASLFGPTYQVPHHKANPDITETIYGELQYFIEPGRVLNPRHPGLEWGEFEVLTYWLYEYLWILLNHRWCTFVLYRKNVTTGMELNLGFGEIKPYEPTVAVDTASNGTAELPAESSSQKSVDTT
ncbi:hypothetical protein IMSHALPRED_007505 [Imshaugia aleurites]|uniref:Uncharacterized protein n=1 Tax=Imshaugia aleurites TaxID=172621 RepID=A0A8H3EQV9_9LECA|nr:hypothetical protein IMSHALPRED_007505 [Imshaugia aleurites]